MTGDCTGFVVIGVVLGMLLDRIFVLNVQKAEKDDEEEK